MPIISENEYTFTSADRITQIHVHEWIPDCDINGVVQLVHGIAEYIERYEGFARFLAAKGFVVVGNDHLGHGKSVLSQDDIGFFAERDGWMKVVSDVEKLRVLTAKKYPGVPYFIFGHSMGSFLTRTHLIRFPDAPITGVVLSGTGQNPSAVVMAGSLLCDTAILKNGPRSRSKTINDIAFGTYNKSFEPRRTDFDWLSSDPAIVDAYVADPLCGFLPTVGLFRDMMWGMRYNAKPANLKEMNKELPVYLMSGDKDPVGSDGIGVAKVYGAFLKAGMKDVLYKFYPEGRHEMLNEMNKDDVMKDILAWLFKKIG
ncbi:MAG: alpha/beta hydrolase [Oscillospiraceae bacterium]